MTAPALFTIPETAARLSCSERHVYHLIEARHLRSVDVGLTRSKTRVREDDLAKYIDRHTQDAATRRTA